MRCALSVGGLDPGGGAGLAADLRAFAAAGAFGCAAAAVITVQSTSGLSRVVPMRPALLMAQVREVVSNQRVSAVKTGALGTSDNVRAVARWASRHPAVPLVVDPVMLPTAGRGRLLARDALSAMRDALVPRAFLVTANAPEAEALAGLSVRDEDEAAAAARALVERGARAVLVKGGHLEGRRAADVLVTRSRVVCLEGPRLALPPLHGGGCVLASLIAGRLAVDDREPWEARLLRSVRWARAVHQRALRSPRDVGGGRRVLVP